jgi:hypothetical protein
MKSKMIVGVGLLTLVLGSAAAVHADCLVGLNPCDGTTMMVKAFTAAEGQVIAGVEFRNNDARTVFPEVILVRGAATAVSQGTVVRRATDVSETAGGMVQVAWSPSYVAEAAETYLVCVRFPAGPGKQGGGVGPGMGATRVEIPRGSFVAGGDAGELTAAAFDWDMTLLVGGGAEKAGSGDAATRESRFYLARATPNPFNPMTMIEFGVDRGAQVNLSVYDVSGRVVRVLAHGVRPTGVYRETWDGRDEAGHSVAAGVYLVRLVVGSRLLQEKLALMK